MELQFVYWGFAKVFVGDGLPALQSYYGHTKSGSAVRISDRFGRAPYGSVQLASMKLPKKVHHPNLQFLCRYM
jgi:hypothetical protein